MDEEPPRLPRWGFAMPGPLRDELTELALAGTKTTTAGLLVEMELEGEDVPAAGDRAVLVDSAARPVAILETIACRVVRLADVDDRHAIDEGEGYADAHAFRVAHERFWGTYLDELRGQLGDPAFVIDDDTLVVAERFRVVARLDGTAIAAPIVPAGPDAVPGLAALLARAFAHDPMATWPMAGGDQLHERVRTMFQVVDEAFAGAGWLWSAADGLGVMALVPPGAREREATLLDGIAPRLAPLFADGGERYERFWAWIGTHQPDEPHWLLDQLAVEPDAHGRGIGGALLREAIARATGDGRPLVLETAMAANVPLYEHHGFRIVDEGEAPGGGPHVWFLRREPGSRADATDDAR
jgi:uncharacterized protein YhfF/GNAT superfamily N-acetyltransferase